MTALRRSRRILGLLLTLLLAGCAAPPEPGVVVVADEPGALDEARLREAGRGLVAEGATVAVLLVRRGDREDMLHRLREAGLARGGSVQPGAMVVYVSLEPRYSELRVGERFSEALPPATLERLRQDALNPALRSGEYGSAFVAAVGALEQALDEGRHQLAWGRLLILEVLLGGLALWGLAALARWAWDRYPASAPVRLAEALWARSPPGRRAAERRHRARRDSAREALRQAREQASRAWERLPHAPPDLAAARAGLEAGAEALEALPESDPEGYRRLAGEFEALGSGASTVSAALSALESAAAGASETLRGLKSALRASRGRRWKKSGRLTPEDRARLDDARDRLADLQAARTSVLDPGLESRALVERIEGLASRFRALDEELKDLWKARWPESQAARNPAGRVPWPLPPAAAATPAAEPPSDGGSTSSDGGLDFSTSSGDSYAGGDW